MEFVVTRKGVMIFVATVEYVKEIVGLLFVEDVVLIIGDIFGVERDVLIENFKV